MDGSTARSDDFRVGPVPPAVYAAMLVATLVGQAVGIAVEAPLGSHSFWAPAAASVLFEALVGARMGASRTGCALSIGASARVSAYYSAGLAIVTIPLAAWLVASGSARPLARAGIHGPAVIAWLAALTGATLARWGLMTAFRPRGR